jgi:predicted dehydrogenase
MFMPATRKVVEVCGSDAFGALRSVLGVYPIGIASHANTQPGLSKWMLDGCHPVSAMVALGGRVGAVTVVAGRKGGGACVMEYESGAVGTLHLAEGSPVSQPSETYSCFGLDGRVDIENGGVRVRWQRGIPFEYGQTTTFAPNQLQHGAVVWEAQQTLSTLENKAEFIQGIVGELEHFCTSAMTGSRPMLGTLEDALHITAVCEAAERSGGRRVEIEEI